MTSRPTPFEAVFGGDPTNRDAFLLDREVVQLLRDVVPDGVGEAVDQHVALLHNCYLFWQQGSWVVRFSRERAEGMLTDSEGPGLQERGPWYIQLPERLVWAQLSEGDPHEPLDGCFASQMGPGQFRVLGIFGFHPERSGLSVAEVIGPRPSGARRDDGQPFFAPLLQGGTAARLYSIGGPGELLELGARGMTAAAPALAGAEPGNLLELA